MIAPSGPRALIGCLEQGVDFVEGQKVDESPFVPLIGDSQHLLNQVAFLGVEESGILKTGANGCQALIPAACTDLAIVLHIVEKVSDNEKTFPCPKVIAMKRHQFANATPGRSQEAKEGVIGMMTKPL